MRKRIGYASGAAVLLVAGAILLTFYLRTLEPRLKERVITALERRFDANVQLKSLQFTIFPRPSVDGEGLVLTHKQLGGDAHPLLKIRHFHANTDFITILDWRNRVDKVTLEGLEIHIPPGGSAISGTIGKPSADTTRLKFLIKTIVADQSLIEVEPKQADKAPLRFQVEKLTMHSVGPGEAMTFTARLRNAVPPGDIDTTGHFGPWQRDDPRATAISGDYTFKNADLSVFKGISGTLSSVGQYGGVLQHIKVSGSTDMPNFALKQGGAGVHLTTRFHSVVDGTNGDTILDPVDAKFGHSEFLCSGTIEHRQGEPGKRVELDASTKHGRMEDILTLIVGGKPTVKGDVEFHSKIAIPPGPKTVSDKLKLDGAFHLNSAVFTDKEAQHRLQVLSERASGHSKEDVTQSKGEQGPIVSNFSGKFRLDNGLASFSSLRFEVPGAQIQMAGQYNLDSTKVDMTGVFKMHATLSETQSGIKELLLKPLDRFFEKNGAGFEVPFSVEGTRSHPIIGVTVFHKRFDIH